MTEQQRDFGPAEGMILSVIVALFVGIFTYHYGHDEGKLAGMVANDWKPVAEDVYVKDGRVVLLKGQTSFNHRYKLEEVK